MKTTPFPRGQVIKPIRPGSYIALSKTPLPRRPNLRNTKKLANAPAWLVALTRRLNTAVLKLNLGILNANQRYARKKTSALALGRIRVALRDLDQDLHGVHWPPVRPPFSNRRPGADTVESARFPLKPQDGGKVGGYVTFYCDVIEDSELPELASWGGCVGFGVVYYALSDSQGSESSDSSIDSELSSGSSSIDWTLGGDRDSDACRPWP